MTANNDNAGRAAPALVGQDLGMSERSGGPDDEHLPDTAWNREERDETPLERLDRNWADLLQELRVVQTQIRGLWGCR